METIFRKTIKKHPETTLHNDGKSTLKLMILYMTNPNYTPSGFQFIQVELDPATVELAECQPFEETPR